MNRSMRSSSSFLGLGAAACLAISAGCYAPGGSGFSTDTHSYVSTSWQPYTITLKDTRTGQNFWSMDVPVGKKLVVHFRGDEGIKGSATPDLMEWEIMDPDEMFGQLDNSVPVPGREYRRLDPTLRATPELPESMGGGVPKPAPSGNP